MSAGTGLLSRRPHELSGRQRVGIARALAVQPKVIIFDKAVAALDLSVQAQMLNLLTDHKARGGFSSLFISQDLDVVRFISDRIGVVYLGRLAERADGDAIFARPHHRYARALLSQCPNVAHRGDKPAFPDVTIRYSPNNADRIAALIAGDVDVIDVVPAGEVATIESKMEEEVVGKTSGRMIYIGLDADRDGTPSSHARTAAPS